MFNGEIEKGEEVKSQRLGMKKYFQIHNYFDELKAKMAIYNMTGKEDIWWKDIKKVKGIKEIYVTWKTFKNILRENTCHSNIMKRRLRSFMS